MNHSLVLQGFDLMLYGMGVVFIFLTLLVYATSLMSHIIQRWFPEAIPTPAPPKRMSTSTVNPVSPVTLKILQAAVDKHRERNR